MSHRPTQVGRGVPRTGEVHQLERIVVAQPLERSVNGPQHTRRPKGRCSIHGSMAAPKTPKRQSLSLSKPYIAPVHCVLVSLPLFACKQEVGAWSGRALFVHEVIISIGFTAVKNAVCRFLLQFRIPAINPEAMMECKWT